MKDIFILQKLWLVCIFLLPANSSGQWMQTSGPRNEVREEYGNVQCLTISNNGIDGFNLFAATFQGVFRSTNKGSTWNEVDSGLTDKSIQALTVVGGTIFAATLSGIYRSTNNGISWDLVSEIRAFCFSVFDSNLFVGSDGFVYCSIDTGNTWLSAQAQPNTLTDNVRSLCIVPHNDSGYDLFAGTEMSGIFLSTNSGITWTPANVSVTSSLILTIVAKPNGVGGYNVFAGSSYQGVFLSTNNGISWSAVNTGFPLNNTVFDFSVKDTNLFAATLYGVFLSANNGVSWTEVGSDFPDNHGSGSWVKALAIGGSNLYAGTTGSGVWRRPLSEFVTSVNEIKSGFPLNLALFQNYPNPFNPTTVISYSLSVNSTITLKILDVLGREIRTLIDDRVSAGNHSVVFDANNLPSGVYFYRLTNGIYIDTKKLTLMK